MIFITLLCIAGIIGALLFNELLAFFGRRRLSA